MKEVIRKFLWKILGVKYYDFLKHQKDNYLSDYSQYQIGRSSYHNGIRIWKWSHHAELTIGNYCSLAHGVEIILDSGFHNMDKVTTYPLFSELYKQYPQDYKINNEYAKSYYFKKLTQKESVRIGNDVWVGTNAMIMPGVSIADGAVVLPGALVSVNVGSYEIFGGVPARFIRKRFDDETIEKLLQIQWWNWDESIIKERINDFYNDPKEFVNKYSPSCIFVS